LNRPAGLAEVCRVVECGNGLDGRRVEARFKAELD